MAVAAARAARRDRAIPVVALACAHPAKFPEAVESAVGFRPTPPPRLDRIMRGAERITVLPKELAAVERFVRDRARHPQEAANP